MAIGRWLVAIGAILWSTAGIFAKAPIFDSWPANERVLVLAFWRAAFASVVLLLLVRKVSWSWRMVPMICCFVAMNWAFLNAFVYAESTTAIWLQYTAPAFVLVGGWLILKETIRREDAWFLVAALLGVVLILAFQVGHTPVRGLLFGLMSGACYAGVILSLRYLREHDSAWLIFLNHAVTAIVFLPIYLSLNLSPHGVQWAYLVGFGVLQLGLPYLIVAKGLQRISSQEASLILLLEPVCVPIWVFLVWRNAENYQSPMITTLLGAAIILFSLAIRYAVPMFRRHR